MERHPSHDEPHPTIPDMPHTVPLQPAKPFQAFASVATQPFPFLDLNLKSTPWRIPLQQPEHIPIGTTHPPS
eukprot:CAMPEP_0184683792 /NCGR_PEP_ID=MMETSP0312-20130426/12608_1 /TAXON_ID=31354 /ORGANISM="Compsopogon coeruleus, Strain SAG 36.94" /LENGTH=71 /DNA_ID=CAMNT_0027136399 /DNA_START=84 /DNA_END=295 /DNA_ORIENTATION=-